MRVRRLVWRTAGSSAGRIAPRAARRYYDSVVASLTRSLLRIDGVVAVYGAGSYATGQLAPGRSDVDLVAAIDADTPEEHARILRLARAPYRRHQAVLPIDLSLLPSRDFPDEAAVHALFRRRIAAPVARHPVEGWRLLAGAELRGPVARPFDPRLVRLTDSHAVQAAARLAAGDGRGAVAALARTAKDAKAEGLDGRALTGPPVDALEAAFALLVASRERDALPAATEAPDVGEWVAPAPPRAAVDAAHALTAGLGALRSATAYAEPFTGRPAVLLEGVTPREAAALAAALGTRPGPGVALTILPTPLAEDPWASGLRAAAIAVAGRHVAGEPLAPRLRHATENVRREHARVTTAVCWWRIEPALLGRRFIAYEPTLLPRMAAHAVIARGGPVLADEHALRSAVPELGGDDLALSALRVRRQTSDTPPARIRSG